VAARRKFVTLPPCVRTLLGELTTLPITVISVAFTVLLESCGAGRRGRRGAGVPRPFPGGDGCGWEAADLWTAPAAVDDVCLGGATTSDRDGPGSRAADAMIGTERP
jgi:hypothetical protein